MHEYIKINCFIALITTYLFAMPARAQYDEKYRPQYHFSPQKGWIGDPDGLVYYKKQYHLFWWGHAVSDDLVHWKEMPYPMQGGDGSFHYFSGSVVVDKNNTAGFGDSAMVAVYTMHKSDAVPESQALSYSNDGSIFQFYDKNPVLDIGSNSFRDPQVFWHSTTHRWIMAAARPHKHQASFYASPDLKKWEHLSDFGPAGSYGNDWEVPDLFQLPLDGNTKNKKWVLSIGEGPNKMQYFIGHFDGNSFTADDPNQPVLWADYGTDFYAARTWRNVDDSTSERTTWLGWMGNWSYAGVVPTKWGKGFESVPRDIALTSFKQGIRLVQKPVAELQMLRKDSLILSSKKIRGTQTITAFKPKRNVYELLLTLDCKKSATTGINLLVGEGRKLVIGYDAITQSLFIDRTNCTDFRSDSVFNKKFPTKIEAPLVLKKGMLKLHILVDQSSVELFANDGEITMSATTFPGEGQTGLQLFSDGNAILTNLKAWELSSIWKQ